MSRKKDVPETSARTCQLCGFSDSSVRHRFALEVQACDDCAADLAHVRGEPRPTKQLSTLGPTNSGKRAFGLTWKSRGQQQ